MRSSGAYRPLIVAFCLWHMAAVALYLLPARSPLGAARALTVPYVLLFSQWQKWDIFAPNPVRKTNVYIVQRNAGDRWEAAMILDTEHLPWWSQAKELKVLSRIESNWKPVARSYLLSLCPRLPLAAGSAVRLAVRSSALPDSPEALSHMADEKTAWTEQILGTASCPRT